MITQVVSNNIENSENYERRHKTKVTDSLNYGNNKTNR